MRILITNDDGVFAPGIFALAAALQDEHAVTVVAPDRERSASSHSLTLDKPLTVRSVERPGLEKCALYSVNGTPVDCVRVGIGPLTDGDPDLLLSGINSGANLGSDVSYSGTVHAALEGAMCGIPALALSLRVPPHRQRDEGHRCFALAADMSRQIVDMLSLRDLKGRVYNINFPANLAESSGAIRVCPQGLSPYDCAFQKQNDPFGREYYWICAVEREDDFNECNKTDVYWSDRNCITLTPMRWDATDTGVLEHVRQAYADVRLFVPLGLC